jgi:hypothetical protein
MRTALTGLVVLFTALAASCGGDDSPVGGAPSTTALTSSTVTPEPFGSVVPATSPTVIAGAHAPTFGDDAPFPADVALIVETGCWQCDGGATGLVRLYRDPTGSLRIDRLSDGIGNFLSFGAATDGSRISASICASGDCSDVSQPAEPPVIETATSEDGGITWSPLPLNGVALLLRDRTVIRTPPFDGGTSGRYHAYPSGVEIARPPLSDPNSEPFALSREELRWLSADDRALIREDASVSYILDQDGAAGIARNARIERALLFDDSSMFLTIVPGGFTAGDRYLALTASNDWRIRSLLVWSGGFYLGGALSRSTVIANVTLPAPSYAFLPALIDMETFTVRPIREPFGMEAPFKSGRNFILAVTHGPFARVVSPGDCLNIRGDPALDAPVLTCAADGVLLQDARITRAAGGRSWRSVITPAGIEGWADLQFLEVRP